MNDKQKIILPGEILATEEEYTTGRNTRVIGGKIISTILGTIEFDETNKEINVKGKSIESLREGDIVIGEVTMVKESSAVIKLVSAENNKRITGIGTAQLPIRNVSNEYVTELKKLIKIGDLVRARVATTSELGIDLITKEKGFGIVKAYCSNCRHEMQYANGKLNCQNCGNIEERKWFDAEDNYKPRQGGFERRDGFGHSGGFRGRIDRGFGGGFRREHNTSGRGFGERREGSGGFGGGFRREHNPSGNFSGRGFDRGGQSHSSDRGFGRNNFRPNRSNRGERN